jgi:hypothetical protein
MNDLAIPHAPKPQADRALIELERSSVFNDVLAAVNEAYVITPKPDLLYSNMLRQFARTRPDWQDNVNRGLEKQRRYLAALPSRHTLDALRNRIDDILSVKTEAGIRRQVAMLLGAFTNGKPADPTVYVNSIIFDLMDMGFPDAVIAYACQDLRRCRNFLPTVAEIIGAAKFRQGFWEFDVPDKLKRIEDRRQAYVDAISHNERVRDEVAKELANPVEAASA